MIILAFFLFAADRIFKYLILKAPEGVFFLWPGVLDIKLYKNYGIGLGLPLANGLIIFLSIIFISCFVLVFCRAKNKKIKLAALFIIIGAFSNLIDRLTGGFVVDYISLFGISFINLSDVLIFAGVFLLLLPSMRK